MSQIGRVISNNGPGGFVQTLNLVSPIAGNINLTSTGSTITITPNIGFGTVNLEVSGTVGQFISGNTGGQRPPTAGNWNIVTANSTPIFAGAGSTLTLDFDTITNFGLGTSFPLRTTGISNTAVGNGATGAAITSGSFNTLGGWGAGLIITTGSKNTLYGLAAGAGNVNGDNITAIGYNAKALGSGSDTTAIGAQSLFFNLNGSNNIALGYRAGYLVGLAFTCSDNIFIGNQGIDGDNGVIKIGTAGTHAGGTYITGIDGTDVGAATVKLVSLGAAGTVNKLGSINLVAGTGVTITPTSNTITIAASGAVLESLGGNTGTATPTANKIDVKTANSTPVFVASASQVLLDFNLTTNLALGSSLPALAGGTYNVTAGASAGRLISSGSQNTFLGANSGEFSSTSNDNVAVGYFALNLIATGSDFNTAIGVGALLNLGNSAVNNIGIGYTAGNLYGTNESNNIVIGNFGVAADSGVIRIGTPGTHIGGSYVTGIDGTDVGSTAKVVTLGAGATVNKLGTATITAGTNVVVTPTANVITVGASQAQYLTNYSVANVATYVATSTDFYITVDTTTIPITIQLPNAPTNLRRFIIKDSGGMAATNNITVTTPGGVVVIDAAATYVMNTNYQAIEVVFATVGYQVF